MKVHSSVLIEGEVEIPEDVEIGAYTVIQGNVKIGKGTKIGNRVTIKGNVTIGENCKIFDGAVIGEAPQHLKYEGEETSVEIGNNVIIREYVTIHRGTKLDKGKTVVGDNVMLMAYSHVAHDCVVGNNVIMANCATLGGHVVVGDYAFIGGLSAVHQWARVGEHAMVGGLTGVSLDIPPYTVASGQHAKLYGINLIGLRRRGFPEEVIKAISKAYRIIFRSPLPRQKALEIVLQELGQYEEVRKMVEFIKSSKRGVARHHKD